MDWRRRRVLARAWAGVGVIVLLTAVEVGLIVPAEASLVAPGGAGPPLRSAASTCTVGLLGDCLLAQQSTPTATTGTGCVVDCSLLSLGNGCVASLLQLCVAPQTSPSPSPTPGLCLGQLGCLSGGGCTLTLAGTCLLGPTPTPAPGCSGGCFPPASRSPSPSSPPSPSAVPAPVAGSTVAGGGGGAGLVIAGPVSPPTSAASLDVHAIPVVQPLGVLPSLGVGGAASVLIPLFAVLDLVALLAVVVVVRRSWSGAALR